MSIRERDADAAPFAWANPGDDQTELDRRTLLAALDALVEAAEGVSVLVARDCWCMYVMADRTKHDNECRALRAAIAAAKEASDG